MEEWGMRQNIGLGLGWDNDSANLERSNFSFLLMMAFMVLGALFCAPESFFRICFGVGMTFTLGFATIAIFDP